MGISPVTNLTLRPLARSVLAELDPAPMERVDKSSRIRDETYSPSGGKSARGSEDDASEDDREQLEDEAGSEPAASSSETIEPRPISFFA